MKERKLNKDLVIVIGFIFTLLIGFGMGASYGSYKSMKYAVHMAVLVLNTQGINITIDEGLIAQGLIRYGQKTEQLINAYNYTKTLKMPS